MAPRVTTRNAAAAAAAGPDHNKLGKENEASVLLGKEFKMAAVAQDGGCFHVDRKENNGGLVARPNRRAPLACLSNKTERLADDGKAVLLPVKSRLPKVVPRKQQQQAAPAAVLANREDDEPMELEEGLDAVLLAPSTSLGYSTPPGVRDIDAEDLGNPQLCGEYAKEMYVYLRQLEAAVPVSPNYLAGCSINSKMRSVLVDWLVEVQQQFKLLQETLFLAVSIIDRYLQLEGKSVHRSMLQLVGTAAMFIASKYEEIYAPELEDFVYITDNAYTAGELRAMEGRILQRLGFSLGRPVAINFLRRFSKAGDVDVIHHTLAKYILEGTMLDYSLVSMAPSLAAATSLYMALIIIEQDETLWDDCLEFYSGYTRIQVQHQLNPVADAFRKVMCGKLAAVRTKYATPAMLAVAEMPGLRDKLELL